MALTHPPRWIAQSLLGIGLVIGLNLVLTASPTVWQQATGETCKPGFAPDANGKCTDVNECLSSNGECDALTLCKNTEGSRLCGYCPEDYLGDGYVGCKDVNECTTGDCVPTDTKPPAIKTSGSVTVAATSAEGAVVKFAATAVDNADGPVAVTCTPASGSTFPVGITKVACTSTDKKGNTRSAALSITVTKAQ